MQQGSTLATSSDSRVAGVGAEDARDGDCKGRDKRDSHDRESERPLQRDDLGEELTAGISTFTRRIFSGAHPTPKPAARNAVQKPT
jgi:hypothetical protein